MRRLAIALAALSLTALGLAPVVRAEAGKYGIASLGASLSSPQAGAHADFSTTFELNKNEKGAPAGTTRDIEVELPPGLIGNPAAFPKCTPRQLVESARLLVVTEESCPIDAQVGVTEVELYELLTKPLGAASQSPFTICLHRAGMWWQGWASWRASFLSSST